MGEQVESLKESRRQLEERCNLQQSKIESFTESINTYQQRLEEKDAEISRLKAANVDAQVYHDTLHKVQQLEVDKHALKPFQLNAPSLYIKYMLYDVRSAIQDISQQRDREEAALRSKIEQLEHAFREKEKAHEQVTISFFEPYRRRAREREKENIKVHV